MLLPNLLDAQWWWTHSSLWSTHVSIVSSPLWWSDICGLISFGGTLGRWPVLPPRSDDLSCCFQDLLEHLCIPLHCATTSSHRQIIYIPSNWLSQQRWLMQIHLQSAYWIGCPFEFIHATQMYRHRSACATNRNMWAQTHILPAHHLIWILILLHLFFLLFMSVVLLDSFLLSLLISEFPSWQVNRKDNILGRIWGKFFSPDNNVHLWCMPYIFLLSGIPPLCLQRMLCWQNQWFAVNIGEENLIFTVKQSPPQTSDYITFNIEKRLITVSCRFAVLKQRHGTVYIMELGSFHHFQNWQK